MNQFVWDTRFTAFVPPPPHRINRRIRIIDPTTMAEVKIAGPPLGSPTPADKGPGMPAVVRPKTKKEKRAEKKKKAAEEEAERKAAEEEAKRKAAEEEAERKTGAEETKKKAEEEEAERKAAEEEATRKAAEEETEKKTGEEKIEKKVEEEEAANFLKEKILQEEAAKNEAEAGPIEGEKVGLSKINSTPSTHLEDLSVVEYPPNVKTPNPANPELGKFRYDREFLIQFQDVCTKKPDTLEEFIREQNNPFGNSKDPSSRQPRKPSVQTSGSEKGSLKLLPRAKKDRFIQSTTDIQLQMSNFQGHPLGYRTDGGSNILSSELGGGSSGNHQDDSQSGRLRDKRSGGKGGRLSYQVRGPMIPMDQVVPLKISENRWVPNLVATIPVGETELIPIDVVMRKVKSLLNKLTLKELDTISDQIVEFANQSVKETDGMTLKVITQLIYESSINDSNFAAMYAQLVHKMLDKLSIDIKDGNKNTRDPTGKAITGGRLFRKYLLKLCQDHFEHGWKFNPPKMNKNEDGIVDPLLLDVYYIAAKEKAHGLGLITFFGELFKLEMLTERVMHECIKKLLSKVADPVEEETESLCKLMTIIGKELDHKKAKGWIDVYFDRMADLLRSNKLPNRVKFMVQDVIDLRSTRWVPRDKNAPRLPQPSVTQKSARNTLHRFNIPPVPPQDGGWSTVLANFDKIAHRNITKDL